VLWYDEDLGSGGSAGAPLAIGTRRPVFVNDTEWFRDLPSALNLRKLHAGGELQAALHELFANRYAEERTWDRVADTMLADFHGALERSRSRTPSARDALRRRAFAALDHKPLRRTLRRLGSRRPRLRG
jgi:hypothetical protein